MSQLGQHQCMQQNCDSVRTAAPFFRALSAHEKKTSVYNEKHLLKCPLLVLSTAMSDHLLLVDAPLAPGHPRPPKGCCDFGGHKESAGLAGVSSDVGLDDGLPVCTELFAYIV